MARVTLHFLFKVFSERFCKNIPSEFQNLLKIKPKLKSRFLFPRNKLKKKMKRNIQQKKKKMMMMMTNLTSDKCIVFLHSRSLSSHLMNTNAQERNKQTLTDLLSPNLVLRFWTSTIQNLLSWSIFIMFVFVCGWTKSSPLTPTKNVPSSMLELRCGRKTKLSLVKLVMTFQKTKFSIPL